MRIFAIDPGPVKSAYVIYDTEKKVILDKGLVDNVQVLIALQFDTFDILVIEMIASYGMPVGQTVFETCVWIGRFIQFSASHCEDAFTHRITRKEIVTEICRSAKAKDSNVRQALIDLFPTTGEDTKGNPSAIGTKKKQGPLYGVAKDMWAALAVAIAWTGKH